jgi:ABC-2 type transport system permease protein
MSAISSALRYEWRRVRSVRSTWVLFAGGVGVNALIALALTRDVRSGAKPLGDPENVVSLLTGASGVGPASFVALVAGVFAVLAAGSDLRAGQTVNTLLAVPRRGVLLTARALVVLTWAAALAAASLLAAYLVVAVTLRNEWSFSLVRAGDTPQALGGFVLLVLATALLGAGLVGVFRRTAVAALALLSLPLVAEPVLLWLADDGQGRFAGVADWLPFTAGQQMVDLPGGEGPGDSIASLGAVSGGLTFAVLAVAVAMLASALVSRRDA